ncbi:MAG TPA: hypothetical protein PLP31_14300 [Thermoanaerobaculaceae bacterium]|nr:hypothetical protein [Thermoanaerobaculaceae bacterium]
MRLYPSKRLPVLGRPDPGSPMTIRTTPPTRLDRVARAAAFRFLGGVARGAVEVVGSE